MEHSKWEMRQFATGIYPAMALLNHSCDPNVTKYFVGSRMYVVADRNVARGEELSENYYAFYPYMERRQRREWLRY